MKFRGFSNPNKVHDRALPNLGPTVLRDQLASELRSQKGDNELVLYDLSSLRSVEEAKLRAPFFSFGADADRKHQFQGESYLCVHWPTFLKSLTESMRLWKFTIPLIWTIRDLLARKYAILGGLLNRAVIGAIGVHHLNVPLEKDVGTQIRSNAYPLTNYEEKLLKLYCTFCAESPRFIAEIDRVLGETFPKFVVPRKGKQRRAARTPHGAAWRQADISNFTFFDMNEFEHFRTHQCNAKQVPPHFELLDEKAFPYPPPKESWIIELASLAMMDPNDRVEWRDFVPLKPGIEPDKAQTVTEKEIPRDRPPVGAQGGHDKPAGIIFFSGGQKGGRSQVDRKGHHGVKIDFFKMSCPGAGLQVDNPAVRTFLNPHVAIAGRSQHSLPGFVESTRLKAGAGNMTPRHSIFQLRPSAVIRSVVGFAHQMRPCGKRRQGDHGFLYRGPVGEPPAIRGDVADVEPVITCQFQGIQKSIQIAAVSGGAAMECNIAPFPVHQFY